MFKTFERVMWMSVISLVQTYLFETNYGGQQRAAASKLVQLAVSLVLLCCCVLALSLQIVKHLKHLSEPVSLCADWVCVQVFPLLCTREMPVFSCKEDIEAHLFTLRSTDSQVTNRWCAQCKISLKKGRVSRATEGLRSLVYNDVEFRQS